MMGRDEQILELVGLIYEAASDPARWQIFLERLAETIGGDGTVLFALDPEAPLSNVTALTRFDPTLIDRYVCEFPENLWVRRADVRFKVHEVRYSQGLTTSKELQQDRYYADFLYPAQVTHSLGLKIPFSSSLPAYLASSRSSRKSGFEEEEGRVLLALAPHIRRALDLHGKIAGKMAFGELLDHLPFGVAFAAANSQLLWWNQIAQEIFRAADGLRVGRRGLIASRPGEAEKLQSLIRQAAALGTKSLPGGGGLAITRPSLRRPYAVLVSPIKKGSGPAKEAVVAVLITDPDRGTPQTAEQRLAAQFQLSPAEARFATALMNGKTVEAAADGLSIAISTARTHVRNLLHKTSTSRQSELVRVLLSGPSLVDQ